MKNEPKKQNLPKPKSGGWKAVNPEQFSEWYNDTVPCYAELSEGKVVQLDTKDKHVKDWINNKIIVKE